MHRRDLASLAALASLALTIGVGCPEEPKPTPVTKPAAASTAAHTADVKTGDVKAAPAGGSEGKMGTATIKGVVNFTGKAPEMKVPKKRKDAEVCKAKDVKYNAVVADKG